MSDSVPAQPADSCLLVVDLLNVAFGVSRNVTRSAEAMARGVLGRVQRAIEQLDATHVAIVSDPPPLVPSWRDPVRDKQRSVAAYGRMRRRLARKGQLPAHVPPDIDEQQLLADLLTRTTRAPDEPGGRGKLWRTREMLDAAGYPVTYMLGFEADDVIASLVTRLPCEITRVVIVSDDRDLRCLIDERTSVLLTRAGGTIIDTSYWRRWKVRPELWPDFIALRGSGTGSAISVRGAVDRKTAAGLLARFGSLDELYRRLDEVESDGLRRRLADKEADVRLLARYAPLRRDLPIEIDLAAWRLPDQPELGRLDEYLLGAVGKHMLHRVESLPAGG